MKYNTTGYDLTLWKKKDVDRYRRLYMGIVTQADRDNDLGKVESYQFQYTDINGGKGVYWREGDLLYYTGATPPEGYTTGNTKLVPRSKDTCPVIVDHEEHIKANLKASERQTGGDHYKKLKIQPMQYSLANNLNYAQANTIKYVTRYKDKNGIEDLKKAIHCIELLIEFEEREDDGND